MTSRSVDRRLAIQRAADGYPEPVGGICISWWCQDDDCRDENHLRLLWKQPAVRRDGEPAERRDPIEGG